jgi:hypothetical protein
MKDGGKGGVRDRDALCRIGNRVALVILSVAPFIAQGASVKLGQRMLVVFAATVAGVVVTLYFLSRVLLLSNFQQLEAEQTKQTLQKPRT